LFIFVHRPVRIASSVRDFSKRVVAANRFSRNVRTLEAMRARHFSQSVPTTQSASAKTPPPMPISNHIPG